ncbi:hypothetical protein Bcav_1852 [Beutenbergia cavernae DSM 12333]|uniref:Uncharacterized protein n=1 Tax=Beutenbergia cavernae (strain ATCC BAA-8 / DSM 12333 / CCUG 43141 / JCM 11478 / NBRC 16432 / NCIMB 13614 / HKI 0122) TaxID=471853 RepID=C5C4Y0_BEUC1|nr:hypothetical protein [Beutenbergia cavernae]ACQ80108.1 hypothetical protein Bcav_1852 [Beutenbergia cavernae DSM 12333]
MYQRRARPGELCTCGNPAAIVTVTEGFGVWGDCREVHDELFGRCPFCEQDRGTHLHWRCDDYQLRRDVGVESSLVALLGGRARPRTSGGPALVGSVARQMA